MKYQFLRLWLVWHRLVNWSSVIYESIDGLVLTHTSVPLRTTKKYHFKRPWSCKYRVLFKQINLEKMVMLTNLYVQPQTKILE